MPRPHITSSIVELEEAVDSAITAKNLKLLRSIRAELKHRSTPRAKKLSHKITPHLEPTSENRVISTSPPNTNNRKTNTGNTSTRISKASKNFEPTAEQNKALELFKNQGSLKINAFAGAGKTSTLVLLAKASPKKGQYIAFNKAIVKEAREKFPPQVNCSTIHGLAFRGVVGSYKGNISKITGKISTLELAQLCNLERWQVDDSHVLEPRSIAFLFSETLKRFAQSADSEPQPHHVPRHGSFITASKTTLTKISNTAIEFAKYLWERMKDPSDLLPLGHDGYLKLWALGNPEIAADYILLDEAQDTNPVVIELLQSQKAQMVYVGDKYQQIYEWRGAVNAMEEIETKFSTSLTTSFRFGDRIAIEASKIIRMLGAKESIQGNSKIESRIGSVIPKAILARTNANTMTATIEAIESGKRPHLVGGNSEMMEMLRGVSYLKDGQQSTVPDFFGFNNWKEVVDFSKCAEGQYLLTFVNMVEARGEKQLMWALGKTVSEDQANIVISTAHRSKGREWTEVRLMDDFLRTQSNEQEKTKDNPKGLDPADLRLFYVALTRAKHAIEVPEETLQLIINNNNNNKIN